MTVLEALAQPATWEQPGGGYWCGAWQTGSASRTVYDPEDGTAVGTVAEVSAAETRAAVDHIAAAWQQRWWPLWQRREAIERAAVLVAERHAMLAELITAEGVKTHAEARREIDRAVQTLTLSARAAEHLSGGTVPFDDTPRGEGWSGWLRREPVGVVVAITPFNDPLNLPAHKLGPALVAGNPVLLKPAEQTPLTALALVQVLLEAGVPGEYLAVLPGGQAGPALVADPRVDVVSFTGGPETADRIARGGPARKLLMELGGNNALIACSDADPQQVARAIVDGAFGVAGQNCLSVQRAFLDGEIAAEVTSAVVDAASRLRVGSKRDPRTQVGPLVSEAASRRIRSWIDEALAGGARLLTGGERTGPFLAPAVLIDVPAGASLRTNEVFGPVVVLETFTDVRDAVAAANAAETGMQAGVFTANLDLALQIADRLRVGAVMINDSSDFRIDAMPFGGFKRSGTGREGPAWLVHELSAPKIVAVHRSVPAPWATEEERR